MNIYQRAALNHYLTAYPEGAHYLDVLDAVLQGNNKEVIVCGIFADMPADFIVAAIRELRDSLQQTFPAQS